MGLGVCCSIKAYKVCKLDNFFIIYGQCVAVCRAVGPQPLHKSPSATRDFLYCNPIYLHPSLPSQLNREKNKDGRLPAPK